MIGKNLQIDASRKSYKWKKQVPEHGVSEWDSQCSYCKKVICTECHEYYEVEASNSWDYILCCTSCARAVGKEW